MSEYQYYEFQAIDRPLTKTEQQELRACSTRASISSRHFKNEYQWGNLKGHPLDWMKRYFDAHLYTSNFCCRAVYLRLPLAALDAAAVKPCLVEGSLKLTETNRHFILCFQSDEEPGHSDEGDYGCDSLNAILPIRAALASGDRRSLYLGWLRGVQSGFVEEDTPEPPVPPGLAVLDDAHQTLATFLEIDPDLLTVAAAVSASPPPLLSAAKAAQAWVATLTTAEKDLWLLRFLTRDDDNAPVEFRQQFQCSLPPPPSPTTAPRTASTLLQAMEQAAEIRRANLADERAAAQFAKQQKAAADRRAYLESRKGREEYLWKSVYSLTATNTPNNYASAVNQLTDLRDLAELTGNTGDFSFRFTELTALHHRKTALLGRLKSAGFM